jgi:hypothetical protein
VPTISLERRGANRSQTHVTRAKSA